MEAIIELVLKYLGLPGAVVFILIYLHKIFGQFLESRKSGNINNPARSNGTQDKVLEYIKTRGDTFDRIMEKVVTIQGGQTNILSQIQEGNKFRDEKINTLMSLQGKGLDLLQDLNLNSSENKSLLISVASDIKELKDKNE